MQWPAQVRFLDPAREEYAGPRAALALTVAATGFGLLHAARLGLPVTLGGGEAEWRDAVIRALGIWWLWALLAPLVFAVSRRWHPERVGLPRALLAHACGAITVSALHSSIYVPVVLALVWPELLPNLELLWQRNVVGNQFGDLITYAALAGGWYAMDYRRMRRASRRPPAESPDHSGPSIPSDSQPVADDAPPRLESIAVRASGRLILVPVEEIEWIEASGDYTVLHCAGRRHLASERLGALAESLDPAEFVRVHRSAIVRLAAVRQLRPRSHGDLDLVLASGQIVRSSRTYRDAVRRALALPRRTRLD